LVADPVLVRADQHAGIGKGGLLAHVDQRGGAPGREDRSRAGRPCLTARHEHRWGARPGGALLCQRVIASPSKRFERGIVEFLADKEIEELLAAPDTTTWIGRRDWALLLVAVQTGPGVSELTALRRQATRRLGRASWPRRGRC